MNGYKSIPKDKLLRIINNNNNNNNNNNHYHDYSNNNNNRDRKSLLKSKKGIYKPTRNSLFKLRKVFTSPQERIFFISKIEKIK